MSYLSKKLSLHRVKPVLNYKFANIKKNHSTTGTLSSLFSFCNSFYDQMWPSSVKISNSQLHRRHSFLKMVSTCGGGNLLLQRTHRKYFRFCWPHILSVTILFFSLSSSFKPFKTVCLFVFFFTFLFVQKQPRAGFTLASQCATAVGWVNMKTNHPSQTPALLPLIICQKSAH